MPNPVDRQPEWRPGDSRLREFLRRANPILAAERGWNERSQLKIKLLADDLELPAELYDVAVERLQKGELNFEDQFTKYEQEFLKYLRKHFTRAKNNVLTASIEDKAIRMARREYEIPQVRARKLVRMVAEQLGMSRVGKLEAAQYISNLIDELVGGLTIIPDSVRGRIFMAGQKWGVAQKQVEIMISNRVEMNRQIAAPTSPWKLRLIAGLASLVVMALIGWAIVAFVTGTWGDAGDTPAEEKTAKANNSTADVAVPRWWGPKTINLFRKFSGEFRAARFPHEILKSPDVKERLVGYHELINLTSEHDKEFQKLCRHLLASCYADEPPENTDAVNRLIQESGAWLEPGQVDNPKAMIRMYENTWRANKLIVACGEESLSRAKLESLTQASMRLTGTSIRENASDYSTTSSKKLSALQWQHLSATVFFEPELAARIIDELGDLTRSESGHSNSLEYSTAIEILSVRPTAWNFMKRTLTRMVESASDDKLQELFLTKNASEVTELQSWLGKQMAQKLGVPFDRRTARQIDQALAVRLRLAAAPETGQRLRWNQLKENQTLQDLLKIDLANEQASVDPQTIAQAAYFATAALILWQLDRKGQLIGSENSQPESDRSRTTEPAKMLQRFDEMLFNPPRNLSVRTKLDRTSLIVFRRIQRRALPSDIRNLETALQQIGQAETSNPQAKAIAFKKLATAAPRIRDIPIEDARTLARFMLTANETSQLVAIEQNCSQIRHWPNLALAMADEVLATSGGIDQALTCADLMTGELPALSSSTNWKEEISRFILFRTAINMQLTSEITGTDNLFQWNELEHYLMELYRLRCRTLNIEGSRISASGSPAELAELLLPALAVVDEEDQIERIVMTNRYLADNDLQLFAMHGMSLLQIRSTFQSELGLNQDTDFSSQSLAGTLLKNELQFLKSLLQEQP